MTSVTETCSALVSFVRDLYGTPEDFIPLHEPRFWGNERQYVGDAIDSTFVSSVGAYVDRFESELAETLGVGHVVATASGTAALHVALIVGGVKSGDLVVTQALTFAATGNAISYVGASPAFVDVDRATLSMSPDALREYLTRHTRMERGECIHEATGRRITACVPMHTFGFPARIHEIRLLCKEFEIALIEDAAESLGSTIGDAHCGTFGRISAISFNGNKILTAGGGGAIVTDSRALAREAKHITTTAKVPHAWEYVHDRIGFNYRMPNLNAALACAQLESLSGFTERKRRVADRYREFFVGTSFDFVVEPEGTRANYWLNTVLVRGLEERNVVLEALNGAGVMARPVWQPLNRLPAFSSAPTGPLDQTSWLADRIVNIPSSVPLDE